MIAEIICVGTEILLGDILNTNVTFLSQRLAQRGISVYFHTSVGDNPKRLTQALKIAFERSDIVITTGGLGPTKDDLTKEVCFEFLQKEVQIHQPSFDKLIEFFGKRGLQVSEGNKKQAYFPKDSIIIENKRGTAPGCIIDEEKCLIILPGPPKEMQPMYEDTVSKYLDKFSDYIFESEILRVAGLGESQAAEMLSDLLDQKNPTVAPYAKEGEVIFRVTAKARNKKEAKELMKPTIEKIKKELKNSIYGYGETSLEEVVFELLKKKNLKISVAESCTGGLLSSKLINISGASEIFLEGIICYSNEAKVRMGVEFDLIEKFGAVSSEVAEEMALKIANRSGAKIGISTTGIAGPSGGSKEKPVGLVFVGICINEKVKSFKMQLSGSREMIRKQASIRALNLLRQELESLEIF